MSDHVSEEDESTETIDPAELPEYEFHRLALIFPLVDDKSDQFRNLADDMLENGMREPAIIYQNKILDGVTRYRICKAKRIQFYWKEFDGDDKQALDLVLSLNLHRRHLNESSRAMSAARAAREMIDGLNKAGEIVGARKDYLHQIFTVSERSIEHAFAILKSRDQDLIDAVDKDEIKVSFAATKVLKAPPSIKQELIYGSDEVKAKAKQKIKALERQERVIEFGNKVRSDYNKASAEGETKLYGVIYIDPPWKFEPYSEVGQNRAADNHYQTMSLEDIRAIPLPAAETCALFLWATVPHLYNAIETLEGWGFEYKSCYAWYKTTKGLGFWTQNELELLLLGTKGNPPAPTADLMMSQVMHLPTGEHSAKPEAFGAGIAKMFPDVPSAEIFARHIANRGNNWRYLGNEIDGKDIRELMKPGDKPDDKVHSANANGNKRTRAKAKLAAVPAPGATEEVTQETTEESTVN